MNRLDADRIYSCSFCPTGGAHKPDDDETRWSKVASSARPRRELGPHRRDKGGAAMGGTTAVRTTLQVTLVQARSSALPDHG